MTQEKDCTRVRKRRKCQEKIQVGVLQTPMGMSAVVLWNPSYSAEINWYFQSWSQITYFTWTPQDEVPVLVHSMACAVPPFERLIFLLQETLCHRNNPGDFALDSYKGAASLSPACNTQYWEDALILELFKGFVEGGCLWQFSWWDN